MLTMEKCNSQDCASVLKAPPPSQLAQAIQVLLQLVKHKPSCLRAALALLCTDAQPSQAFLERKAAVQMDAYDEAADCDAGEDDDSPPLARAASRGQVDTVMALLPSGARISERRSSDGKTAAHLAAEEGHAKVRVYACALGTLRRKHQTRSARKRGAPGAASLSAQPTISLPRWPRVHHLQVLECLLAHYKQHMPTQPAAAPAAAGASQSERRPAAMASAPPQLLLDMDGWLPLHYAAYYGDCRVAELMLGAGRADVQVRQSTAREHDAGLLYIRRTYAYALKAGPVHAHFSACTRGRQGSVFIQVIIRCLCASYVPRQVRHKTRGGDQTVLDVALQMCGSRWSDTARSDYAALLRLLHAHGTRHA